MGNIETIDPDLNKPIDEVQKTFDGSVTQNPQTTTLATINTSDTISQFMEKVNNNFTTIMSMGGGPAGVEGEKGDPGAPTKPKVPIHVWVDGVEYYGEKQSSSTGYYYIEYDNEILSDIKYQEGHIIMLQNAHVYRLELNNETYKLEPKFLIALQSYDPSSVVNGKTAYMHIAYSNSDDGSEDFITDKELRENTKNNISGGTKVIDLELGEPITPFSLKNTTTDIEDNIQETKTYKANYQYMGIYCDNDENPKTYQGWYTWFKIRGEKGDKGIQGETGPQGPQGKQGEKGDNFTGHSYTIDLEGDMSMIPINIDRKTNGSCECVLHAYYGNNNVKLDKDKVKINISEEYKNIGDFEKEQSGNDVIIKFKPDENFVFPTTTIMFTIHVDDTVRDTSDNKVYRFIRDTVWMVKGIVSTFSLEIRPNYHSIKLDEKGNYTPETLIVDVYKYEDGKYEKFDLTNSDFELKYKKTNTDDNKWYTYNNKNGISTKNLVSCVELKVVKDEEIWDYEDVWVVADGKNTHYYHADLGAAESMMVLITGDEYEITNDDGSKHKCAIIRKNSNGCSEYSITFDVTFFDGSTPCVPNSIDFGSTDELYVKNETFVRTLTPLETKIVNDETKYVSTLTITSVPANVEMIPMSFIVQSNSSDGNTIQDIIYFNVYISTLSDIFTLVPTKTSFNTSVGKNGEKIGCNVFKDYTNISNSLTEYNLSLYYQKNGDGDPKPYVNPLTFGAEENGFVSSDKYIDFILYHTFTNPIDSNQKTTKEIAISTIPLIKDGINGEDGNNWQYIFCRSSKYPFVQTGFSYPSDWKDDKVNDPNNELLGNNNDQDKDWYGDHKGVDSEYRYEYQSYRKWDKDNKKWSKFGDPTLYSNYSESGSGYSVILSNPIAIIPVGDDWSVNEDAEYQKDSTVVYLYNNMNEIKRGITLSLPNNPYVGKNFKCNENTVEFEPVVEGSIFNFDGNNQYKLPITLTYENEDDKFSTTVYWTLTPIKGTVDIEVFVDKYVVNTSEKTTHSLQVGYTKISDGKKTTITKSDNKYKIKLTDNINNLSSVQIVEKWDDASYNFVKNNKNINCYVVLLDSDDKIIDYVIVTAVNNGEPGKSAIHLELTQDYISLPGNGNGGIDSNYNVEFVESEMILYNGDTPIVEGLSYSFKLNKTETGNINCYESGKFKIPTSIIKGNTTIECVAIYNNISYYKTLSIVLVDTVYELEINKNKNIITRNKNTGEIIDKDLEIFVKYLQNGNWNYTDKGTVIVRSAVSKYEQEASIKKGYYVRSVTLNNNKFKQDTQVEIYFKDNNGQIRTKKTIGIVDSGKDGVAGKSRVLFYLGSFKDGTLDGDTVNGLLTDERCDYYIDFRGDAWMRIGTEKSAVGYAHMDEDLPFYEYYNDSEYWQKQDEKIGFLKAGAISADMIAAGAIKADKIDIGNLTSNTAFIKNLHVDAANINGELNIGTGNNQVKITEGAITANMINAADLHVKAVNIDGKLTADKIDANNLKVKKLNTNPETGKSSVNILNNQISICDNEFNNVCVFSDNELKLSIEEAFGKKNIHYILVSKDWNLCRIEKTSEYTKEFTIAPEDTITNIGSLTKNTNITISSSIETRIEGYNEETKWYNDNTIFYLTIKPVIYIYKDNSILKKINGSEKNFEETGSNIDYMYINNELNEYEYKITEDGFYKIGVGFAGTVNVQSAFNKIDIPMSVTANRTTVTVDTTTTTCKTEICKDGIFIKRETNGIIFGNDGILFKFGNNMLKISDDGIKYSISYGNDGVTPNWKSLT